MYLSGANVVRGGPRKETTASSQEVANLAGANSNWREKRPASEHSDVSGNVEILWK